MADYNKLLYQKVSKEFELFEESLRQMTPDEIIDHAYEKVIKEEMMSECLSKGFEQKEAKALYIQDFPLDFMYRDWLKNDLGFTGIIGDSIDETVQNAIKLIEDR